MRCETLKTLERLGKRGLIHGKFAQLSSLYTGGRGNGWDRDVASVRDVLPCTGVRVALAVRTFIVFSRACVSEDCASV